MRIGFWNVRQIMRPKPWSLSALLIVPSVLAVAVGLRVLLDYLGATLYFATFFPAVLIAALLAGVPAGACAALLAIPIVWWGFLPPAFEFNPLTPADYSNFTMFLLFSALLVWFADLCRDVLLSLERIGSSDEVG